jgi:hypothetical protein
MQSDSVEMFSGAMYYLHLGKLYEDLSDEQRDRAADFWQTASSEIILEIYIQMRMESAVAQNPAGFMSAIEYCQSHKDEVEALHRHAKW